MRTIGGPKAIDSIGDPKAAAAFFSTMFEGSGDGAKTIQEAIHAADPGAPSPDGKMGPQTLADFSRLVQDPKRREALSDALATSRKDWGERKKQGTGFPAIVDGFRF